MKIDKDFVDGVTGTPDQSAVVRAVIPLAHTFNLQTVAEGIEREEQCSALQALGSDLGQGYLFSKPLDSTSMEVLLGGPDRLVTAPLEHPAGPLRHLRALSS